MSNHRELAIQYAHQHQEAFLNNLKEIGSIPSVSTEATYQQEVKRAAEWVAAHLKALGLANVQIFRTDRHPIVYGEDLSAGAKRPTGLVYGHYDVQPAEPLELWESPAFEPAVRGEELYGRGVSDMKGQVIASLAAVEAILKTGKLPINLKFIFEGEEEIGSPHLGPFIHSHLDLLSCDFAINPDTGMIDADIPTITYALRGISYFELRLTGPDHDLHSGTFGGTVHNPAQVMCELIAGMHDNDGRITLPGFYDKVRPLEAEERRELARLPMGEEFFKSQTGVPSLWGEKGFTPVERTGVRPTLEVNGLISGYTGPGAKTVIPHRATAKISMRLVPDQNPAEVKDQLLAYLKTNVPPTVRYEISDLQGGPASISDRNSPYIKALSKALETVWGTRPMFKRDGGSVPVVTDFQNFLGVESLNTGFGLLNDKAHAPNEKLHLPTFYKGIDALIHLFYNLAE